MLALTDAVSLADSVSADGEIAHFSNNVGEAGLHIPKIIDPAE